MFQKKKVVWKYIASEESSNGSSSSLNFIFFYAMITTRYNHTLKCVKKKENGREWWDGMERFVLYIAHTFEVHVCVVSLSFTKLRLNLTKTYKSVITWLTNGLCFVTESRDNILSHLSQPNRFYPAGGVLFGFQKNWNNTK